MDTSTTIHFRERTGLWATHREATLNWLALGLLLAAWNAADDDASSGKRQKPESLRGYAQISVRAVQRAATHAQN